MSGIFTSELDVKIGLYDTGISGHKRQVLSWTIYL